jgi:hypothetical protein
MFNEDGRVGGIRILSGNENTQRKLVLVPICP